MTELPNGHVRRDVAHGRLVDQSGVDFWKADWTEWLEALEASVMS